MATKTATKKAATATKTAAKKIASTTATRAARAARTAVAEAPSQTRRVLTKSRTVVPLLVAVGLGAALIRRLVKTVPASNTSMFKKAVKNLPPKVTDALEALAALGREVRASTGR